MLMLDFQDNSVALLKEASSVEDVVNKEVILEEKENSDDEISQNKLQFCCSVCNQSFDKMNVLLLHFKTHI